MTITLNRQQRCAMRKLSPAIDRVTNGDRLYFERFPHRRHRVRLASHAEMEQFAILDGVDDPAPPLGCEHYIVVRNVVQGFRLRRPFTAPAGNDCDVDEAEARWLYETRCSQRDREIEEAACRARQ